jgi:hypothetical protein
LTRWRRRILSPIPQSLESGEPSSLTCEIGQLFLAEKGIAAAAATDASEVSAMPL